MIRFLLKFPVYWLIFFCVCIRCSSAQTIHIDFGFPEQTTTGHWNNVTSPLAGVEIANLIDQAGQETTIGYRCVKKFLTVLPNTQYVDHYPDSASQDAFLVIGESQIELEGLSTEGAYELSFFALAPERDIPFALSIEVEGESVIMQETQPTDMEAVFKHVLPDASGRLSIYFRDVENHMGYVALMSIQRMPSIPAQFALTEFMASNTLTLKDLHGNSPDWIEITNLGDYSSNIGGWHLTDDQDKPKKWVFPPYRLAGKHSVIVFASGEDRLGPEGELHCDFKLKASGEYLALTDPYGSVVTEISPAYPPQVTDISFGIQSDTMLLDEALVDRNSMAKVKIANNDSFNNGQWTLLDYDDRSWQVGPLGVGYDTNPNYRPFIQTDVGAMRSRSPSVCLRIPFTLDEPTVFDRFRLRMMYDDGFVAYINGVDVARSTSVIQPEQYLPWTTYSQNHPDQEALVFEEFDISLQSVPLWGGENVLAIHGFNDDAVSTSSDLLILPELYGLGTFSTETDVNHTSWVYMTTPTPGQPNMNGIAQLGPQIVDAHHEPMTPLYDEPLQITVELTTTSADVALVTLYYRVMYEAEQSMVMQKLEGNIYAAEIPAGIAEPGQMVRWRYVTEDRDGIKASFPRFVDTAKSPRYYGTVIANPHIDSNLDVYHWFTNNYSGARGSGARASVFFKDRFYDNVFVRRRAKSSGMSSAGKPCLKFDFNPGYSFYYDDVLSGLGEINLNNNKYDKSLIAQILGMRTFALAGAPYSHCDALHVCLNGDFFAIQIFVEQLDEDYLRRHGLDEKGALYKALQSPWNDLQDGIVLAGLGKRSRRWEGYDDVIAFGEGVRAYTGTAGTSPEVPLEQRARYVYDHVDIAQLTNYTAAMAIIHGNDHHAKNHYLYRDTEGTGLWFFLPWDLDLSHGHNFASLNNNMHADELPGGHPLWACSDYPRASGSDHWNGLIDIMMDTPAFREMHLRRLRTLMDRILEPPGQQRGFDAYEMFMDDFLDRLRASLPLEISRWHSDYTYGGATFYPPEQLARIKSHFLKPRRTHLFEKHSIDNYHGEEHLDHCVGIPHTQTPTPIIVFGRLEVDPVSGDQDEEYIELINEHDEAIDISDWQLKGAVKHHFTPGTVIPARGHLYVTPNVQTFLQRSEAPHGGMDLFIQGNYRGHLNKEGEILRLHDDTERLVQEINTVSNRE